MCYTSVPYTQHDFIMQHKYIKITNTFVLNESLLVLKNKIRMRVYYKFESKTLLCAFFQLILKLSNHI